MVRLLDASIELNTFAGAFNMFSLWILTASLAGLVFALCARQPRPALIGDAGGITLAAGSINPL